MDILKAEIARKRKQIEASGVVDPEKKYFKRGDLAEKQDEEYRKKYGVTVEIPKTKEDKLQELNEELNEVLSPPISRKEVIRKLRERMQPILLFAENELESFKRLRKLEILEPEINKGLRNDFKEAMDAVDKAYQAEVGRQGVSGKAPASTYCEEEGQISMDLIKVMAKGMGKGDKLTDQKVILKFIELLLKMWGEFLQSAGNTDGTKSNTKMKIEAAMYSQTQGYIKPLISKLKKGAVPDDILDSLVTIVTFMLDLNYVRACDTYLQMAIGNAPWPIGVTMVGIHERTGREKIFSKHVAHVLNDETQRKYIQALKRLMTKCQFFFPTDPSHSVDFMRLEEQPPEET